MLISLYFSKSGAEDFQTIIEKRWEEVRCKPSNPEQTWLIPQPSRNWWGDTREFNKVNLVRIFYPKNDHIRIYDIFTPKKLYSCNNILSNKDILKWFSPLKSA